MKPKESKFSPFLYTWREFGITIILSLLRNLRLRKTSIRHKPIPAAIITMALNPAAAYSCTVDHTYKIVAAAVMAVSLNVVW